MEETKKNNKKILIPAMISLIVLILAIVFVMGRTLSFFAVNKQDSGTITGTVASGSLSIEVSKILPTNTYASKKLIPQLDSAITSAVKGTTAPCIDDNVNAVCNVYKIEVTNNGGPTKVWGNITLNNITSPNLKWASINTNSDTTPTTVTLNGVVNNSSVTTITEEESYTTGEQKTYYIVVWISETGLIQTDSGTYTGKVTFSTVEPPKPNSPDVVQGLIPVYYDGSNWKTTDTTNTNNKWYDYDNKKWANAILVDSTVRTAYQTPETTVDISKVLAFYVWIPRYKYKVWNINKVIGTDSYNAQTTGIDIVWEKNTASTGTISCTYDFSKTPSATVRSEDCTGSNGDYYTHPAFTFGNDELRGIWVGKFEVSSETPTATDGGGTSITLTPRILPNVQSWRYNPISNQWKVIYDMQKESNIYGLSTSRTDTDSHMMTNMEWGAVAYLTNSKYGRCTDNVCTEVSNNNSKSYYTGRSAGLASVTTTSSEGTYTYETDNGQLASTTGNIYGIYDMRGGSYEYVMGNMGSSGTTYTYYASSAGSNYTYTGYEKYLTTYKYGTSYKDQTAYNRGRLGDATGEVVTSSGGAGGWYSDYAYFPRSSDSWFRRGGYYGDGADAGMFYFGYINGSANNYYSSRASLLVFVQ